MQELTYEVLVLDGTPRAGEQRLPSGESIVSSPLSVVLIAGEETAVLVDAPYTYGQVERVRNWIADSGKRLESVYITHGHGDHWLGVDELISSFPGVTVYATPGTLRMMASQGTEGRAQLWDKVFPGLIPPSPVIARPVPDGGLELEGYRLEPVELGHAGNPERQLRRLARGHRQDRGPARYWRGLPDDPRVVVGAGRLVPGHHGAGVADTLTKCGDSWLLTFQELDRTDTDDTTALWVP